MCHQDQMFCIPLVFVIPYSIFDIGMVGLLLNLTFMPLRGSDLYPSGQCFPIERKQIQRQRLPAATKKADLDGFWPKVMRFFDVPSCAQWSRRMDGMFVAELMGKHQCKGP
jgi:hypothetical protein